MQTNRILAALSLVAALSGCSRELSPQETETVDGLGAVVFSGTHVSSKTSPSSDGTVSWSLSDRIGVYDGQNYVLATVLSANGKAITFSAEVNADAESYIAVTPYEAVEGANSFSEEGGVRMLACTAAQQAGAQVYCIASTNASDRTFQFRNVGNMIRFSTQKEGVVKAKLEGNNSEKIAGTVTVNPSDGTCSAKELTEGSVTVPVTKGENFIALAPGISLASGFTLTLYGDADCTDYQGEICGTKALALTRNGIVDLDEIDGMIDNYKLYQAGKPITIAGVEYSKTGTGYDGKLLSATTADFDLFNTLYGKSGVFFLEQSGYYKFTTSSFINIGSNGAANDVILISRYDSKPVTLKPVKQFTLMDGNFVAKGVNFEIKEKDFTAVNYLFRPYTKTAFGNLHLDACKYSVDSNTKKLLSFDNFALHAVKSFKVVNSRIESTYNGMVQLAYTHESYPYLNEIEEVTFDNCVVYNPNAAGTVQLFATAGPAPTSDSQRTAFTLTGCTFYNMAPTTYFQSNSMRSLTVKNNLFYSETAPSASTIIAYSKDDKNEYVYEFDNNFCGNYSVLYWFNPNSGIYKSLKKSVTKTSESMFSKADTSTGVFVQTEAFKNCGSSLR